ncbi:hypothetical protein TSMEX_010256 [Taenia solium]|eukprot:TsM_000167200 transcript=TsM_000167200 gene=TsM_000167200
MHFLARNLEQPNYIFLRSFSCAKFHLLQKTQCLIYNFNGRDSNYQSVKPLVCPPKPSNFKTSKKGAIEAALSIDHHYSSLAFGYLFTLKSLLIHFAF